MAALTSRVWQRYGQLRIYVSADAEQVGWCDPRSGRFHLSEPALERDFWAAVQAECERLLQDGRLASALARPRAEPDGHPPQDRPATSTHWVVRDPGWDDLALNQPGASAVAHARELRAQRPFLTTAASLLGVRTRAASFAAGAKGERVVGRRLNRWADRHGWHVLHAVPVGRMGADIDHVVIGRFGVVTVNTKTTRTRVWVGEYGMTIGGRSVDYLRKSRAEGRRARRLLARATGLDVPAQPVIVFVGERRFAMRRGGPADVAVLSSPRSLCRWLRRQPPVLTPDQVTAVYRAARDPATWQGRGGGRTAPPPR